MNQTDQVLSLLGLAMRARKIATGEELVISEIRRKHAKLVIISNDASENTKKTIMNKCNSYGVPCVEFESRYMLGYAIGKAERVSIAILDGGFAKKMQTLIHELKG